MMTTNKFTHPGNLLLAGFVLLLLLMVLLVFLCMRQPVVMVSKNYYQQELVYQQQLDAMNNTTAYDSTFQIHRQGMQVVLRMPATLSRNLEKGTLVLYCPSDERLDRSFGLVQQEGVYVFNINQPLTKDYTAKISFVAAGKQYYKEMPLVQR